MIKNIIFDMGNVLILWNPKKIVARQGLDEADSALLEREVFQEYEWVSMDHGIMSQEEKDPLDPVPGMAELVREVKALGYHVYLCSNATSPLREYFDRIPGSECFEGRIVSADVKLLKPQHEIYETLFETFGLKPEECFFIDDSPLNIDGAYAVGMPGAVWLNDMARLRARLREAGVPVKE